jgi:hypothetical protein
LYIAAVKSISAQNNGLPSTWVVLSPGGLISVLDPCCSNVFRYI